VSSALVDRVREYEVRPRDTLRLVSARLGVAERVITADNGLTDRSRLVPGQRLRIASRHIVPADAASWDLVINVPQRHVFQSSFGVTEGAYPIAVGRPDWPTPLGMFTVLEKETNPTWDVPVSIQEEMRRAGKPVQTVVPPGPDNPLGAVFLRLSFTGLGMHGTAAPESIYRFVTHGCIRLHPDDIAELHARVEIGTRGRIVYQAILLAKTDAGVFLEAHPDPYRRGPANARAEVVRLAHEAGVSAAVDWQAVDEILKRRDGVARSIGAAALRQQ
jgi:L,D-transpeptidase ErfK/SrfK